MAGTVATVPAAKRAVHHLTAPHHAARPVHRVATAAARPAAQPADCPPIAAGPLPAVPLATFAAPIPEEPAGATTAPAAGSPVQGGVGAGPSASVLAAQPPVGVGAITPPATTPVATPTTTPVVTPTPVGSGTTPAVPEPASWLMMIVGAGALGATLRRRRAPARAGRHAATGAMLWAGSAAEAGDAAATAGVAAHSGAATSALATAAGKAMLCVCPAAVVAGSVVGVPPLRQAVHAATLPTAPASVRPTVPCIQPAAVPVSATAVKGFPDTVTTATRPS